MRSQDYFAYLLRLRHVDNGGHPQWVITLHEAGTDHEQHFADLIALINFLNEMIGPPKEENR